MASKTETPSGLFGQMKTTVAKHLKKTPKQGRPASRTPMNAPVRNTYDSNDVDIPADFLTKPVYDSQPATVSHIDFTDTIPANKGRYAAIVEHALSPSECKQLLALVEASAQPDAAGRTWRPAMVNVGNDYEVMASDYRRSERIIWDTSAIADRVAARCLAAPGVRADLAVVEKSVDMLGPRGAEGPGRQVWRFAGPNERLRFLKYKPGDFFDKHCDGSFEVPGSEPRKRSHYTLHLYLNSSAEDGTRGGETTFWSNDEKKRVDVEPVVGRVLIFQHKGLYHSGEEVTEGTKYTMRTDLMYTLDEPEE